MTSGLGMDVDQLGGLFLPFSVEIIIPVFRCNENPRGGSATDGGNIGVRQGSRPAQGVILTCSCNECVCAQMW